MGQIYEKLIDNPSWVEDLGERLYETVKDKYDLNIMTKTRAEIYKFDKMIDHQLNKILFFDIETVGMTPDLNSLEETYPEHFRLFINYLDWFKENIRIPKVCRKMRYMNLNLFST